jgi:hypothetical protein
VPVSIGDALADAYKALHDEELSMFPDSPIRPDRIIRRLSELLL